MVENGNAGNYGSDSGVTTGVNGDVTKLALFWAFWDAFWELFQFRACYDRAFVPGYPKEPLIENGNGVSDSSSPT